MHYAALNFRTEQRPLFGQPNLALGFSADLTARFGIDRFLLRQQQGYQLQNDLATLNLDRMYLAECYRLCD